LFSFTAEVSLSGIKNFDTLIKGPYIAVLPGEGIPVLELEALEEPPSMMDEVRSGLNIVLEAPALGSLKPNWQGASSACCKCYQKRPT
jgi:paraquat-inducible protein B